MTDVLLSQVHGLDEEAIEDPDEVVGPFGDDQVPDLDAAAGEETVRIVESPTLLESDLHVIAVGEQRAHVPGGRVVEPESPPAQVDPLGSVGDDLEDLLSEPPDEGGDRRGVAGEEPSEVAGFVTHG